MFSYVPNGSEHSGKIAKNVCKTSHQMFRTYQASLGNRIVPRSFKQNIFWTVNISSFIGDQIQALLDWIRDPESIPHVSNLGADPNPAETDNIHTRFWQSQQVQGRPAVQPVALVSHAAMSGIGSYKTTFAMLAAIAFLGASLSWTALFTGARGDLVILAWASAAFIAGSIAAGSMGIIVDSDNINLDRDMGVRRALRCFAITSALMTFVGIILLGVATAGVEPTYTAVADFGDTTSRQQGMQAAGWFVGAVVVLEVILALVVRVTYHTGSWRF